MINRMGWYFPDIDSHFAKHISEFPETAYQQNAINEAYKYVRNFNNAIDVGANIGLHTVRFAQKFENVVSFEPVSTNYECLEKNCSTFLNVKLNKFGLGNNRSEQIISMPQSWDNCGAFSIVDFIDEPGELISEHINILTLDELNLSVDFIKIDTQGFEAAVLEGATNTLLTHKPVLLLEIEFKKPFNKILNILTPLGYQCVGSVKKDKVWVHVDNL